MCSISSASERIWLTEREACAVLGLSRSKVGELRRLGVLAYALIGSRSVRYRRSDLEKFVTGQIRGGNHAGALCKGVQDDD